MILSSERTTSAAKIAFQSPPLQDLYLGLVVYSLWVLSLLVAVHESWKKRHSQTRLQMMLRTKKMKSSVDKEWRQPQHDVMHYILFVDNVIR